MVIIKCDLCKKDIKTIKSNTATSELYASSTISFTNKIDYAVDGVSDDYCLCNNCTKELYAFIQSKLSD